MLPRKLANAYYHGQDLVGKIFYNQKTFILSQKKGGSIGFQHSPNQTINKAYKESKKN